MKYNERGKSRIEVSDILNYFKDIDSYYNDCTRYDTLRRMLEDIVAETKEDAERICRAKMEWIPCSETVDIPDHEIMACDKYGELMFGYLAYEDEQWICASDGCEMVDTIAWCEKPEPWKEVNTP